MPGICEVGDVARGHASVPMAADSSGLRIRHADRPSGTLPGGDNVCVVAGRQPIEGQNLFCKIIRE
jgi:hypothetical protein